MSESSPLISQLHKAARLVEHMPAWEMSRLLRQAIDLLQTLRESAGEMEWDPDQEEVRDLLATPSVLGSLPRDFVGQLLTDAADAIHSRQLALLNTEKCTGLAH